jgi:hypothetical protein
MKPRIPVSAGVSTALLGLSIAGSAVADSNNPGFESGLTGWAALSGTNVSIVQDPVHGGVNAASLSRRSASGPAGLTDSPDLFTGLTAGVTCTASAWVHGPVGYKATVKLVAKNGTTVVQTVAKTISFDGTWQELPTATLVIPSGASTADLQYVAPAFPLGMSWNLDDTQATCGTAPPPPPGPTPTDQAIASGIFDGNPIPTYGAYPYDFNNDGLQDVLIEPHNLKSGLRLYRNVGGGHFTLVDQGQFVTRAPSGTLRTDFHGCDWADVNRDGLADLFCMMGANHGTLTDKANALWIQQSSGGFSNAAAAYGVTDPTGPGRDAAFLDVNRDGYPDLYITNAVRPDGSPAPNRLFINVGGTSFRDATEYGLDQSLGGLPHNQEPAQAIDVDHDGWTDLFVDSGSGLRLYLNNGGIGFTDVTARSGLATGAWRYAVMADVNKDGWMDVVGFNGNATQFRIQLAKAGGTTFGGPVGTRAVSAGAEVGVGDTNGDGNPDVYIVTGSTNPDTLLLGNGSGTQWTVSPTPQATSGSGQSVIPFDYNQNGTVDMIVMNGADGTTGPIQLITFDH